MEEQKKRIVIFGSGGHLGIPLCQSLADMGHTVIGADRFFFGKRPYHCETYRKDTRTFDPRLLDGADAVIDLAGLSNDASAEIDKELTYSINVTGGWRLADLAKSAGVKRYVYSSSCSVYGNGADQFLTEGSPVNPLTEYARSKISVEERLDKIVSSTFQVVVLRNATVFGLAPRMRFDLAVNVMTMRAWRDQVIYVMGGGQQWRPFIHVSDVVAAFHAALEMPIGTYNVGFDSLNLRIIDLAAMVRKRVPAMVHHIPDDPDKRSYRVSFSKIAPYLSDPVSIGEGIDEIVAALSDGRADPGDPTTVTLEWYKKMIQWEKTLNEVRLDGRIL